MKTEDLKKEFSHKCKELGGVPKLEDSPIRPFLACESLDSLDKGIELVHFIRRTDAPDEVEEIVFDISGIEKAGDGELEFWYWMERYGKKNSIYGIPGGDIFLIKKGIFGGFIPDVYEHLDRDVKRVIKKELESSLERKGDLEYDISQERIKISFKGMELSDAEVDKVVDVVRSIEEEVKKATKDITRASSKTFIKL